MSGGTRGRYRCRSAASLPRQADRELARRVRVHSVMVPCVPTACRALRRMLSTARMICSRSTASSGMLVVIAQHGDLPAPRLHQTHVLEQLVMFNRVFCGARLGQHAVDQILRQSTWIMTRVCSRAESGTRAPTACRAANAPRILDFVRGHGSARGWRRRRLEQAVVCQLALNQRISISEPHADHERRRDQINSHRRAAVAVSLAGAR